MTSVIERLRRTWLFQRPDNYQPPIRIVTILMYLAIVVTPIVGGYAFWRDSRDDLRSAEVTRCEQRIESRHGSRARALTNIEYVSSVIRVIDEYVGIPDELHAELTALEDAERDLVDEQLPVLTIDTCLNPSDPVNMTTAEE